MILSVFIASTAQILLKISAGQPHDSRIKEYLNPYVVTGYVLMLASTVLTMLALRTVPLSWSPVLESLSYIFVAVMGYFILKERSGKRKKIGFIIILFGIIIFSNPF